MHRKVCVSSFFSFLMLCVGNAHAQSSATASASLSDIAIELIDLAPRDGIAPAVVFSGATSVTYSTAAVYNPDQDVSLYDYMVASSLFGAASSSVAMPNGFAWGQISGSPMDGDGLYGSASAVSSPSGGHGHGVAYSPTAESGGNTSLQVSFTLTPNTLMLITAKAWDSVAISTHGDYADAQAYTGIAVYRTTGNDASYQLDVSEASASVGDIQSELQVGDDSVAVTFTNGSSTYGAGFFDINTSTSDAANGDRVSSVPEPGSPALLFAGIGVIGMALRRRRS